MGAPIDETGNQYGRLTVIERAPTPEGRRGVFWQSRCSCGNVIVVCGDSLRSGNTKSCGCHKREYRVKDEIGNKYGRLTVIARAASPKKSRAHWLCRCECGNQKVVEGGALRRGKVQSCGCLLREQPTNTLPDGEAAFRRMYYQYRNRAKRQGLHFELSPETFRALTQQPCHYCGQDPSHAWKSYHCTGDYVCNGIDRKDNEQGYISENCVPCCKQCNYLKKDTAYADFVAYLDRISAFRTTK